MLETPMMNNHLRGSRCNMWENGNGNNLGLPSSTSDLVEKVGVLMEDCMVPYPTPMRPHGSIQAIRPQKKARWTKEDCTFPHPTPLRPQASLQVVNGKQELAWATSWNPDDETRTEFLKLFASQKANVSEAMSFLTQQRSDDFLDPRNLGAIPLSKKKEFRQALQECGRARKHPASPNSQVMDRNQKLTNGRYPPIASTITIKDDSAKEKNAQRPERQEKQKGRGRGGAHEHVNREDQWQERLDELIQYKKIHGNCLVPHNWAGNRRLAQWVKRQRYQHKLKRDGQHHTLREDRIRALDEIGFIWKSHPAKWEEKFAELEAFHKLHGHCHVPSTYPTSLGIWVKCQRRQYRLYCQHDKRCTLTPSRIARLKAMEFCFMPRNFQQESQEAQR